MSGPDTHLEARIRKLLEKNPPMTDAQIARKIGRDTEAGIARVRKVRENDARESSTRDQAGS